MYSHEVTANGKNNATQDYSITIFYPPKFECSPEKIVEEFKKIWPKLTLKWLNSKGCTMETFLRKLIENHAPVIPNLADLILALLTISPTTAALERSYSRLAKICYKDRNSISTKNLETNYLLACLGVKGEEELFSKAREILQKK